MKKKRARARARDCEFRIRFRQPLFDASVVFVEVVFFIVIITRARARALHGAFEKKKTREKLSYLLFFFSDDDGDVTTCAFWIQNSTKLRWFVIIVHAFLAVNS